MQYLPFESFSKSLLFAHLFAAVVALASSVHLLIRFWRVWRGAYFDQARLHARILAISYSAAFVLGSLVYPTFRIRVRYEYLDGALPWATGLFEIKELAAPVALIPAIGVWLLVREIDFKSEEHRPFIVACALLTACVLGVLAYNAWAGWYLGTLKSV